MEHHDLTWRLIVRPRGVFSPADSSDRRHRGADVKSPRLCPSRQDNPGSQRNNRTGSASTCPESDRLRTDRQRSQSFPDPRRNAAISATNYLEKSRKHGLFRFGNGNNWGSLSTRSLLAGFARSRVHYPRDNAPLPEPSLFTVSVKGEPMTEYAERNRVSGSHTLAGDL